MGKQIRGGKKRSLFFKLSIRLGIVGLVFLLVQLLAVIWMYIGRPNELDQLLITAEADRVASEIPATPLGSAMIIPDDLKRPLARDTRRAFLVHDRSGQVVARFDDGDLRVADEPPMSFLVIRTQRESWGDRFLLSGTRRVNISDQPLWITVAISGEGFRPFIPVIYNEIQFHVIFPLIILSFMFLLFNFSVVRTTLKPLNAVIATVDRIDPAHISTRIETPTTSWEAQALVAAVNRMLERVERSVVAVREFAGNAAHELRTPLAVMMLRIGKLPEGEVKSKLLKDAQGMKRLVDQMLDMAHATALKVKSNARADLKVIARDIVADLTPLAVARGRSIVFNDAGAPTIHGHGEAISRALRNVIENALLHTPAGTVVEVTAGPGECYSIRDHGPGIPVEQRTKVFERFYRLDKSSDTGTGLGLAIVLAILQTHEGHIEIETAPGGGALIHLMFRQKGADGQSELRQLRRHRRDES